MFLRKLPIAMLLLGGLGLRAEPAPAASALSSPFQKVQLASMESFRQDLTRRLILELQDPPFRALLGSRLDPGVSRIALNELVRDYAQTWPTPARQAFAADLANLDADVRQSKGLEAASPGLLGLEIVWPRQAPRVLDWDKVLLAVRPQGPAKAVTQLAAYDLKGQWHPLDARTRPEVPVLLPGADRQGVKQAGLTFLNEGLRKAGLAQADPPHPREPVSCGKLTFIRLADNQEPWWKGKSEVYAFVAGIDPSEDKPTIKALDLPYLGYANTDYFPNQLLLYWKDFRFGAANFQLWEQDDGTNYQDVLSALLAAAGAAMAVGGAPVLAWIPALGAAIIKAMPSEWYKDTDDFVDVYYTLERGRVYEKYPGAANNAVITLVPYTLSP